MNLNKHLHWFICIIFLTSCARQSSPTGGPKDTIPPVLQKAIPPDEAINYKGKELQLLFSEDVILNAPKEQLIVTPTIGKEYEITARKKSILISFAEPLRDSTTYTFNFRESIQDITEKNPVENLQVAFSTGSYIDSLSIDGSVFDLIKGKAIKEATVALHVENDTFSIFEHPAVYFTKTDVKGKFKISHLKPDNYFIYAFEDKNRNLVVDTRTESYGFLQEHLYVLENVKDVSLGLIRLDARPLKMTSARAYNTYFNIRTTKNLRTFSLSAVDSSDLSATFGEDQANIRLYKTTDRDSLQIQVTAIDSIDNRLDTLLYAKYLAREVTPEDFGFSIESASIIAEKGIVDIAMLFTKPVKEINFDSLFFKVDSLKTITFTKEDLTYDENLRKLTILKNTDKNLFVTEETQSQKNPLRTPPKANPQNSPDLKSKQNQPAFNQLYVGTAAFISIENDSSKRLTHTIKPLKEADLSILNIEIRTDENAFIVELIDNNFKVIKTSKNKRKVRFEDLIPAEYQIRLIIDNNKNGRWDPGNYFKKVEPEKIIYYRAMDGSTIIKGVKANWDIGAGEMFITY